VRVAIGNAGMTTPHLAEREDRIAAPVDPGSPRWYRVFHVIGILITPLAPWYLNRNLFVTPATGWLDPWLYTGYFLSFPSHLQMFGETYYATRLAWLLPGFVAHRLFSPLVANYVLHLSFLYVLLFSVYHLISTAINRRAGLLAVLMFGWNPTILAALSWDYIDGAGIVFIVLTLTCLEKLSRDGQRRSLWALSAGASMVAMICSNLFLIVLWPVFTLFLLMRVGLVRWRSAASGLLVAATGAMAMLVTFAVANARLGGPWLFLGASLRESRDLLTTPNIWRASSYVWLLQASWLALPVGAAVGALATLVRRKRPPISFAAAIHVSLLLTFGIWVVWEARGVPVLFIPYYASYLFPFALLALFVQGPPVRTESDVRTNVLIELGLLSLFVLAHWIVLSDATAFWWGALRHFPFMRAPGRLSTDVTLAASLLAIASWRFVKIEWLRWAVFGTFLIASYFAVPGNWPAAHGQNSPRQFDQTAAAHRFIQENVGTTKPRFWYYATALTQLPFVPIASTYLWGYVIINQEFPELTSTQAADLSAGTPLVLLVRSEQEAERARPALAGLGLDYTVKTHRVFGNGDTSFMVVIASLVFADTDVGQRRVWTFRQWQAENGATVQRDSTTSGDTRATISLPPNGYAWTATANARNAPSGRYVAASTLKGEGALTIRVSGLDKPWPVYQDCPVSLTPAAQSVECVFTKPVAPTGVEIAFMNTSNARVVVATSEITTHKQQE
jgi:hypothetical protein